MSAVVRCTVECRSAVESQDRVTSRPKGRYQRYQSAIHTCSREYTHKCWCTEHTHVYSQRHKSGSVSSITWYNNEVRRRLYPSKSFIDQFRCYFRNVYLGILLCGIYDTTSIPWYIALRGTVRKKIWVGLTHFTIGLSKNKSTFLSQTSTFTYFSHSLTHHEFCGE